VKQYGRGFFSQLFHDPRKEQHGTRFISLSIALLIAPTALIAQPKVSPDEQKMAQAIDAAPDAAGKAKAAADFVKKYPRVHCGQRTRKKSLTKFTR